MTPTKIADRRKTLLTAGHQAARDVAIVIEEHYGIACAIDFVDGADLTKINNRYWKILATFKNVNGFKPGELVNAPKIMALTMFALLTTKARPLFKGKGMQLDRTHVELCYFTMCLFLVEAFMAVKAKKVPNQQNVMALIQRIQTETGCHNSHALIYALCMYFMEIWYLGADGGRRD